MPTLTDFLDRELKAAGIPIDGVGLTDGQIRVDFRPEATQQQRAAAQTIVEQFDFVAALAQFEAEQLENQANWQALKETYIAMINRLEQIQNASTIPFTQAGFNQVVQAVKDEALYIERIMKFLKSLIT